MDPILHRFRDKFIEEANGLLDRLEKDLLDLENKPASKELIESAFRAMHTIKGVSGMYGFDFICEFTHHMESVYQSIREDKLQFNKEIFDITFQSVDHLRKLLTDEKLADTTNQKNHNSLIDSITRILSISAKPETNASKVTNTSAAVKEKSTWHILLQTTEKMFFRGISLVNIFKELSGLGDYEIEKVDELSTPDADTWNIFLCSDATQQEINEVFLFIEDDCTIVNLAAGNVFCKKDEDNPLKEVDKQDISILDYIEDPEKHKNKHANARKEHNHEKNGITEEKKIAKRISVDSVKLDHLMFLVSELITVNSQLNLASRNSQYDMIRPYLEKVDALSKQFRNNAIEIRLVPLGDMVLRFQRLIRDLSKQLNKKVEFVTKGTNTELDKNTIDQLTEPLMHIIRNCLDHGIETPEVRLSNGKPEQGVITLSAYNSGNNVYIEISDDGSGIDVEKVHHKAIEKGLAKPHDKLDKKDIYDFIFMPGFSTAMSLTEVSGRGVGMDVVKRRINDLRGEIMIDSGKGIGTTFTLKLQQSLSIVDSLLFTIDDNYFTVPISDIEICSQTSASDIDQRRHTSTLPFNNQLIPFVDLRSLLNLGGSYRENLKVIIIKNNDRELALLSDRIVGEHQAVLKPLGRSLRSQKYITSASQLGDGNMAFMIDINTLMKNTAGVS
ncbi:MAG TPA: chemotaxis protein CheA [Bacteroidales bacterium]